jgi:hypothetical protein
MTKQKNSYDNILNRNKNFELFILNDIFISIFDKEWKK